MGQNIKRIRIAAIIIQDDSILLVLHRKENKEYFLLPGGGKKKGEKEQEALERELLEETGLSVTPGPLVFKTESKSPDNSRHIVQHVYLCKAEGRLKPSRDPRVVRAGYVTRRDFSSVTLYPNIKGEILEAWKQDFSIAPRKLKVAWET